MEWASKTTIFAPKLFCLKIEPAVNEFLSGYFDRIFVVSVPRFENRHQSVKESLQGLSFDFFWGADKLKIDQEAMKKNGSYDEAQSLKLQRRPVPMNTGEIACSLSHRMVYEEMIKHNWQKVLILEDDVLPLYANLSVLKETMNELPGSWELVYLGYLKHETATAGLKLKRFFYSIAAGLGLMKWSSTMVKNMLPRTFSAHLDKAGFHDCTHAYAVTLEAAKKLKEHQTPLVYRADDLLSATIMKGELDAYICRPKFFDQQDFHHQAILSEIKEQA